MNFVPLAVTHTSLASTLNGFAPPADGWNSAVPSTFTARAFSGNPSAIAMRDSGPSLTLVPSVSSVWPICPDGEQLPAPDGSFTVVVQPTETTQYRLVSGTVSSGILRVPVAVS